MALEVISFTPGGGNTVIRLGLLSALAQVVVTPNGALANSILLFGNLGPDLQQTACQGIEDGGAYADGRYADLTFIGEYDPGQPWELQIPSDFPNLRAGIGGKLSGTFAEAQSGAGTQPPYVRVGNITRLVTPGAPLMWPLSVSEDGTATVTIQLEATAGSPTLMAPTAITLTLNGAPTTAIPTDIGGGAFTFTFDGGPVVVPGDVVAGGEWQPGLRGDAGEWLTAFSAFVIP